MRVIGLWTRIDMALERGHRLRKRAICAVIGHDDIRRITGLTRTTLGSNVGLAARVGSAELYCMRCRRVEPIPPLRGVVSPER